MITLIACNIDALRQINGMNSIQNNQQLQGHNPHNSYINNSNQKPPANIGLSNHSG